MALALNNNGWYVIKQKKPNQKNIVHKYVSSLVMKQKNKSFSQVWKKLTYIHIYIYVCVRERERERGREREWNESKRKEQTNEKYILV